MTGASGFLGSHIAEQLALAGHEVRLLLRPTSSRAFLTFPFELAAGDVTKPHSLPAAVSGVKAVVHAAGLVKARSEAEFRAVNGQGTANLVSAASEAQPAIHRFVYVSSLAAHGPSPNGRPRPLDAPARPVSAYGGSKLLGEQAVRTSSLAARGVIFRPPVVYGPRDPAFVPVFRLARRRLAPLLNGGRNRISAVYAQDAARAIAEAATSDYAVDGKTYTLDDGEVHTSRVLALAIAAAIDRRVIRFSAPFWTYQAAALANEIFGLITGRAVMLTRDKLREFRQPNWVCDHAALNADTGWTPAVPLAEGMRLTAAWYQEHGWI